MLRIGFALGCVTALVSLGLAVACTSTMDDCNNTSTCPSGAGTSNGGGAGKSNSGGKSGSAAGGSTSGGDTSGGSTTGGSSSGAGGTGASGMAGAAGMAGAGGGGGECDTTKSPTEEACLVSDDYAIFVAPNGDDGNAGGKDAPLASVTKAVEIAAGDKLILVCSGTYDEHVSITAGAHIFGGFKCADWSADTAKPLFKPTTTGPALKVDTVADELVIESLSFEVGDAVSAGETALTAVVNASPKVTLRSVSLKSGKGKAGTAGTLTPFTYGDRSDLDGNNASGLTGGAAKVCMCPGGAQTSGGGGGNGQVGGQGGGVGTPALSGGAPGTAGMACNAGGGGGDGHAAQAVTAALGASVLGAATGAGWSPKGGADATVGGPGQGGGGGASSAAGGGGSGGCGSCGGAGGKGGLGGGASIALLVSDSAGLTLEHSDLSSSDAGNAGSGSAGQLAQTEAGFAGIQGTGACPGGNGGLGAAGGAGGGGAGGVSAGVVWKGAMAPTVSVDTTIAIGKAGAKGAGGVAGTNDGIAGMAQKILPVN